MNTASLSGHVLELFDLIRRSSGPSDRLINTFFRNRRYLGARDRRFISDTLFGMLRSGKLLEYYGAGLRKSAVIPSLSSHSLLLFIAYLLNILHLEDDKILESVREEWTRLMPETDPHGLLGVLRNITLPDSILEDPVRRNEILHSLPGFVVREWVERFGKEADILCKRMNEAAPVSVRVNRLRASAEECREALVSEGIRSDPGVLAPDALILSKRVGLGGLRTFRLGWCEMQDEGSQVISYLADPFPGAVVVDGCAGGGGKSLHMAALMKNTGIIHAFDISRDKLKAAQERAARAGITVMRLHGPGESPGVLASLGRSADRVLVDAPCSGTGVFRRNPWSKLRLTERDVETCIRHQRSLLREYAAVVKPGGYLIYATCSLLKRENEEVVEDFLKGDSGFSIIPAGDILNRYGIRPNLTGPFLTLFPHRHGTDGFFGAVMMRGDRE